MASVPRGVMLPALAALCVAVAAVASAGQPTPAPAAARTPAAAPSSPDSGLTFERIDTSVRFENDGRGRRTQEIRLRVRTTAGLAQASRLIFTYDTTLETLTIDSIEVIKPDGKVLTPGPESVVDVTPQALAEIAMYSGFRQRHVVVPGLAVNDVVRCRSTTVTAKAILPGHFSWSTALTRYALVESERLTIDVPAGRHVDIRWAGDAPPESLAGVVDGDRRLYHWARSNPTPRDPTAVAAAAARGRLDPPEIRVTTFRSWEEAAATYANASAGRAAVTPAIRTKADELTRGLDTPRARLDAIYRFVTFQCRYVSLSFGQGLIVPHSADEVLRNLHGDCKDRHVLLSALAAAVGIDTLAALVSSNTEIDVTLPSLLQFDHMVTVAPLGQPPDRWLWLDTTSPAPPGLLLPQLRNKRALLVAGLDGKGPDARVPSVLVTTPADPPFEEYSHVEVDAALNAHGTLAATVRMTVRGGEEVGARALFRLATETQRQAAFKGMAASVKIEGDPKDSSFSEPTNLLEPFAVTFAVQRANWLTPGQKDTRLALPAATMPLGATEDGDWTQPGPVTVFQRQETLTRISIVLPAEYPARAPVDVDLRRDYAEYRSEYRIEGQRMTIQRVLRPTVTDLPGDRKQDYLAFVAAIRADEAQTPTLDTSGGSAAVSAAPAELYAAALRHFNAKEYDRAIELWRQLVTAEPGHATAWDALGLAYERLGKDAEAESALREQARLEPFHHQAWTNLGMVLEKQKRFHEAEAAFRKQLEVAPLDKAAYRRLGLMLLSQQRYKDGEPVLGRSLELEPDNFEVASALGRTRVKLGDAAGAIAAFERAMRINTWPGVIAEFALAMAEDSIGLDRAWEWSKTAMQKAAADSLAFVNGSVDKSTPNKSRALSWAWFAHGWIAFRRGDFATAERYLLAARAVRKAPAIQDHLGQVYDRLGRPTDAAKYYGESLAIEPNADTRRRLIQIVKTEAVADDVVEGARTLLVTERIIGSLGQNRFPDTGALLVLVFTNGTPGPETHWLSGSEDLKALLPAVRSATYPVRFPDTSAARLAVPGMLGCPPVQSTCGLMIGEPIPLPPGMRGSK